jgi:hypothetical protein
MNSATAVAFGFFVLLLSEVNQAQAVQPGGNPDHRKDVARSHVRYGRTRRAETVTGNILMVIPDQRIVALAVRDAGMNSQNLAFTRKTVTQGGRVISQTEDLSVTPVAGEVDFSFQVNRSTLIWMGGRRLILRELALAIHKRATVKFLQRSTGNLALEIQVTNQDPSSERRSH